MTKFVNTSGHPGPDWPLSAVGIADKIREIGSEEFGLEILDVSTGHSNPPTNFNVSTSEGVGILHVSGIDEEQTLKEIRDHFRGKPESPLDVPVIEETKPENLPEDSGGTSQVTVKLDAPEGTTVHSVTTDRGKPAEKEELRDEPEVTFNPSPTLVEETNKSDDKGSSKKGK